MRLLFITLVVFALGCGGASPQEKEKRASNDTGDVDQENNPTGNWFDPCDKLTVIETVVNGQTVVVQVPTPCTEDSQRDLGDPDPDQKDSDTESKWVNLPSINERVVVEQPSSAH